MTAWAAIEQSLIAATGGAAIWLANDPRDAWRRWACVVGLAGQPLWFHTSIQAGQWGVFALTLVFTAAWLRGFFNAWVRRGVVHHRAAPTDAVRARSAAKETCTYSRCSCPFDAPADPGWCARGLPHAEAGGG